MESVLITGITGGIGSNLAKLYCKNGYKVYGTCSRNSKLFKTFCDKNPNIKVMQVNHNDLNDVRNVYNNFFKYIQPDIVINNAGIVRDMFLVKMPQDDFQKVLTTNLFSAWLIAKELMSHLSENDHRKHRIINVSSISGIIGREGQCNYALTKGGLIGLSQLIEHSSLNNRVTSFVVAPGLIDTGIKSKISKKKINDLESSTLAKRIGSPIEVANFIFKLSEKMFHIVMELYIESMVES